MKYAFTITTNNKKIGFDEQLFRIDMLRYLQIDCGYDVRNLHFVIEKGSIMGYHAHGILEDYIKAKKGTPFFMRLKPIHDIQEEDSWLYYMEKEQKMQRHEFFLPDSDDE